MIEIPKLESVPYGYCECRCGEKTWIATCSYWKTGWIKGQPVRFLEGHNRRIRPIPEAAEPFKIEGVYCRLVPLTQGQWAIVWESDYLRVMETKWFAHRNKGYEGWYAHRGIFHPDGRRGIQTMQDFLSPPPPAGKTVDHISGCGLDNRQANFRFADPSEQVRNRKKDRRSSNKYKGYKREGNKFRARLRLNGKEICLGIGNTEEEAAILYDEGALKYFGAFARLNFPNRLNSAHEIPAEVEASK